MRKLALYSLAGIRLANGVAALFAPKFLAERLGLDPHREAGVSYPFRLFGVRTVLHAVLGDAADRRLREAAGLTGELSCCWKRAGSMTDRRTRFRRSMLMRQRIRSSAGTFSFGTGTRVRQLQVLPGTRKYGLNCGNA
ncbi:hypothetical protein [Streptomyces sp. NPDC058424]|uniref:hypothetical protein n=1 Tax=Streptomyces sp. NPDC058424 TaxID=3346491 RepID=UPI00366669D0